jgi:hypothetical protein
VADSTPQDVAVAFRSFPRRLRAALDTAETDADRAKAGPLVAQLEDLVRDVARTVGVPTSGAIADVATNVADAVENRPADQWTSDQLEQLREAALEGGRLLRQVETTVRR